MALGQGADIAQIVVAGAAVWASVAIPIQIAYSRRTAREERTTRYYERWTAPDVSRMAAHVVGYLTAADESEVERRREAWRERPVMGGASLPTGTEAAPGRLVDPLDVYDVVAFFCELGEAYCSETIDRSSVARQFREVIPDFYEPMRWLAPEMASEYVPIDSPVSPEEINGRTYRKRTEVGPIEPFSLMARHIFAGSRPAGK